MKSTLRYLSLAMLTFAAVGLTSDVQAAEGTPLQVGEKLTMTAPADWKTKPPAVNFIEYEFETPVAEGDPKPGRVTVMGAAGGVEANVARWEGQFKPEGDAAEVKAKVEQKTIAGQKVHIVDIKGIYIDKAGPFVPGPGTERSGYRMLGAIIQSEGGGDYFVKMYGPEKTMAAAEPGFKAMIEGLKAK
ncbi:MAG: hypothetical protein JNK76_11100 [Planctomycetales bacterium]|nr:hypothetical protein [Planctomycetales bacterium]